MSMDYLPGAILILSCVEVICYSLYMRFIPGRFTGIKFFLFLFFSAAILYLVNRVFYAHLGYPTALLFYTFLFGWILIGYRLDLRAASFHLLIFFMSGHCLKQIFGNIIWAKFWQSMPVVTGSLSAMQAVQIGAWLVYGVLYGLILIYIRRFVREVEPRTLTWNRIVLMVPAVIPVLYISYLTITLDRDPTVTELMIEAVSSFCGLLIIINQERAYLASSYQIEIARLENAMRNQYESYLISTEAAERINQACHDLKNQMIALRDPNNSSERNGYLQEMEKTINKYQSAYHTGDGVLDGVLYEKGRRAEEMGAQLVSLVDGTLLSGMRPVDVCTLVGNLLDNALEACEKNPDQEKRTVMLKVTGFKDYVLLRCENPITEELVPAGSDYLSTKADADHHGWGLKGIRHVVSAYQGELTIDTVDQRFVVSFLLPNPVN